MDNKNILEQYISGLGVKYLQSDEILKGEYESFIADKKGISDEELDELLKEFPEIPNSLIELLKYSNGTNIYCFQSDVDAGKYPYYLIDSATMIESKNDVKKYYSWAITREFDDIEIDTKITNDIENVKWLLFSNCMNNGGTSQLFIDFTPSKDGKVGQVVRYLHDPDSMIVIANSFDEYLQKIIDTNYAFVDGLKETNEWLKNNPIKPQKSKNKSKIGITLVLSIIIQLMIFILFGVLDEIPTLLGMLAIIFFLLIPTNIILFIIYIISKIQKKKKMTILEKWEIDCESYKDPNYKVKTWEIQCYKCKYKKIEKGLHCEKLGEIPKDILSDKKVCEFRKIKLTIKPMEGVNEIKFGMTRAEIHSLWDEPKSFNKEIDNYGYCHICYDSNDLFEGIEIVDNDLDIYYENTILPSKYSDILRFFENIYDDIEEDGNGFISKKGSVGVYIENDEDIVDAILFGKKGYYLE